MKRTKGILRSFFRVGEGAAVTAELIVDLVRIIIKLLVGWLTETAPYEPPIGRRP